MSHADPLTCGREKRRDAVRAAQDLNGLDYLEVSADQRTLTLYFLGKAPQSVRPENVVIEGGRRVRDLRVKELRLCVLDDPDRDDCMHVTLDRAGDASIYRLCLAEVDGEGKPTGRPFPGFDPRYACLDVDFKIGCPSDLDCKRDTACPPEPRVQPRIDYLAKDYASFRQLMLDRLSLVMPGWRERHVPDIGIALVELLAYVGDHLSYYQDAVATEAYLGTARRRISVRRHARLVDYPMHEGCNARAWLCVETSADVELDPEDVFFITRVEGLPADGKVLSPEDLSQVPPGRYEVFEPVDRTRPVTLVQAHNRILVYTWGDGECCLEKGATRATLLDRHRALRLRAGDLLLFEERLGPKTGHPGDADPSRRHVVRLTSAEPGTDPLNGWPIVEVEWDVEDALPFPLCLSSRGPAPKCRRLRNVSVARGNILLVDHGRTVRDEPLGEVPVERTVETCREDCRPPEVRRIAGRFRPALRQAPLTFAELLPTAATPAARLLGQDPRRAVPAVRRLGPAGSGGQGWTPRRDLLASGPGDRHFVVEMDEDGRAHLRFGDGRLGRAPAAGVAFAATYRVGNGPAGDVGAGAIAAAVLRRTSLPGTTLKPRNPLAARGGTAPEPLSEIKLLAPHTFRSELRRAITADDYARLVERGFPGKVQRAAATLRWTGGWHEVLVAVDAVGGEASDALLGEIAGYLHRYRRIGHDVVVRRAVPVPLEIELRVCVLPGHLRAHVREALLGRFSSRTLPDGSRGLFHPDELTFGQGIALSRLIAAAQSVPGVESVRAARFERLGEGANGEIERGFLALAPLEVARFDNDSRSPGNGLLRIDLRGGR